MTYEEFVKLHSLNPHAPDSREMYRQYMLAFEQMSEIVKVAHLEEVAH